MTMDGQEVFKFAVKKVPQCIMEVLDDTGVKAEDVRYFAIHQANYRIIESIAKRLKVNVDRFPVNMEHYGNTSGASVPLLLDEMNRKGMLSAGDKVVLSGFGAGLTWGAALLEWYKSRKCKRRTTTMLEKMKEIIAEQLSVEADTVTEASSFKEDLGADSLDLFELVMALEDEYSVEIPAEDLEQLTTVGEVMNYLKAKGVEA